MNNLPAEQPHADAKEIQGYPGYLVTKDGRVWSASRLDGLGRPLPGKWLRPGKNGKKGYLFVGLHQNGKARNFLVHRLVLEAFVGPCPAGMEACHNNGVRTDNRVENLRWDTHKRNQNDMVKHGHCNLCGDDAPHPRGESHGFSKLTDDQVRVMRYLRHVEGFSESNLARRFGVSQGNVSMICSGKTWGHVYDSKTG